MDFDIGPKTLVFIRHGQSLRNLYGNTPFIPRGIGAMQEILRRITDHGMPLTDEGIGQARATGLGLRKRFGTPDVIYYSDYLRTMQTTEAILGQYSERQKSKIICSAEEMLRERCLGPIHNMTYEEAKEMYPDIDSSMAPDTEFGYRPPGGESLLDMVRSRSRSFFPLAFSRKPHCDTMFVVSHFRYIQCCVWNLSGIYEKSFNDVFRSKEMCLPNCGIVVYKFDKSLKRMVLVEHGTTFYER